MSPRHRAGGGDGSARIPASSGAGDVAPAPRRQPRQTRAQATVAAITEAAGQLLIERGYARTSTNLIARRAGVSVGSLYQYFSSKEAIFGAILAAHAAPIRELGERALETMADPARRFPDALREVLASMVEAHRRDDELMRALAVELGHVFQTLDRSQADQAELVRRIAVILDGRPDCAPRAPDAAARLILIACQEVTRWLLHRAPRGTDVTVYHDLTVRVCERAAGFHGDLADRGG